MTDATRPGVLFVNFGGPRTHEELEPFLRELFDDVLPLPRWIRRPAARWIASRRALTVREAYERIGFSPLVDTTLQQLDAVRELLGEGAPPMAAGMLFTPPTVDHALQQLVGQGVDSLVALAMFPQYSVYTTGSAFTRVRDAVRSSGHDLPVHFVPAFHDHPAYIQAVASTVRAGLRATGGQGPLHLLFSPHGIPVSAIRKGDPYADQTRETCRRVVQALGWDQPWHLSWQSRVGPTQWLNPSTIEAVQELGRQGVRRLCVVPISFVGEHIETLDELDIELANTAVEAGIEHFARAPALGTEPAFIRCMAEVLQDSLADLTGYRCFRCLVPQPSAHRLRRRCERCGHGMPDYLQLHPPRP